MHKSSMGEGHGVKRWGRARIAEGGSGVRGEHAHRRLLQLWGKSGNFMYPQYIPYNPYIPHYSSFHFLSIIPE